MRDVQLLVVVNEWLFGGHLTHLGTSPVFTIMFPLTLILGRSKVPLPLVVLVLDYFSSKYPTHV